MNVLMVPTALRGGSVMSTPHAIDGEMGEEPGGGMFLPNLPPACPPHLLAQVGLCSSFPSLDPSILASSSSPSTFLSHAACEDCGYQLLGTPVPWTHGPHHSFQISAAGNSLLLAGLDAPICPLGE